MFDAIKLVFWKEFNEARRDKRAMMVVLFLSIILPLSTVSGLMLSSLRAGSGEDFTYTVTGGEYAPEMMRYLTANGLKLSEEPQEGSELELIIPENYQSNLEAGIVSTVQLRGDLSKNTQAMRDMRDLVRAYAQELAARRLLVRGISPITLQVFQFDTVDTGEISPITRFLAPGFIFIFLLVPLYAMMPSAIDSTTGERERHGTMPLLVLPIPLLSITIGKLLLLILIGLVGLSIALTVGFNAFPFVKLPGVNIGFDFSLINGMIFIIVALPSIMLMASLGMAFACYAKTFKEGQTYIGMSAFIPVAALFSGFLVEEKWQPFIPFWAEERIMAAFLSGTNPTFGPWLIVIVGYGLIVSGCLFWVTRTMQRNALRG